MWIEYVCGMCGRRWTPEAAPTHCLFCDSDEVEPWDYSAEKKRSTTTIKRRNTMTLDFNKPLQMRNGRKLEIYHKERRHGAGETDSGYMVSIQWDDAGKALRGLESGYDLINVPEQITKKLYIGISQYGDLHVSVVKDNPLYKTSEYWKAINIEVNINVPEGYGFNA